jgi:hypothetical protein
MFSGYGKARAYLNRFKIIDDPMCPCNEGEQTVEHLIYVCTVLEQRRSTMIKHITTRGGIWLPTNNELTDKYLTVFTEFVKSIDFTKVQQGRHSAVQYKLEHVVLLELYWSVL